MKSTVKKTCQACKVEKSLSDFHRNRTKPDGTMEFVKYAKLLVIKRTEK